jgi:NAD(P)H-hydrate epimerase
MYVLSREEMQEIDRYTTNDFGLSGSILMEYAGARSALCIFELLSEGDDVAIFCGHGNNGGDGFVIARCLQNLGIWPTIFFIGDESKMSPETATNFKLARKMNIPLHQITSSEDWLELSEEFFIDQLCPFSALIDAIFGIGFKGSLPDLYRDIVIKLNEAESLRVAIDISSGLEADTGWAECAFLADYTFTMAAPKYGHYLGKGRSYSGEVIPIDIGIPQEIWEEKEPFAHLIDENSVVFPYRNRSYHKGNYGRVAIIGGSPGYSGAAILAAKGALHSGSGLITLFHHRGMETIYECNLLEVMTRPLPFLEKDHQICENCSSDSLIELPEIREFLKTLDTFDVLLIGPGSGVSPLTTALVNIISREWNKPAVFDADALNVLAHYPHWLKRMDKKPFILTPHIGEFARLSQRSTEDVMKGTLLAVKDFLSEYDCNLLLKGVTRIFSSRTETIFDISGNDGLATGGSGDVLSGIIVSFLAQKLPPAEAAISASFLLGTTAETCSLFKDTAAIIPSDIIENLFLNPE